MTERKIHLNFHGNWAGEHLEAWSKENDAASAIFHLDYYKRIAKTAERGLFDAVFYASGLAVHEDPGRPPTPGLDPVVLAAALASITERIGFVVTVSTTFNEPYNVARMIASLDHVSGGRGAWNVVTTYDERASQNFGLDQLPPKHERYEIAQEFVDVVLELWDSWEPAAFVKQPGNRLALDRSHIRAIEHVGKHYKVRGPLQTPRSQQTRPVLFQAGASEDGKAFASRIADGIFCVALDMAVAKTFYADMKGRIAAAGRDPTKVHVLPGFYVFIGSTEAEARKLLEAQSTTDLALKQLAVRLNTSVNNLKLDETVPDEILENCARNARSHGHSVSVIEMFRRNRLTVREFLTRQPVSGPHRVVCGAPEQIADDLETWFKERAADGFNIANLSHAELDIFVDHVIPILQKRHLYRREYEGTTLRANFVGQ